MASSERVGDGHAKWERSVAAADVEPLKDIIERVIQLDHKHYHSYELGVESKDGYYFLEVDFKPGAAMMLDDVFTMKMQMQPRVVRTQLELVELTNTLRIGVEIRTQSIIDTAMARAATAKRIGLKRRHTGDA